MYINSLQWMEETIRIHQKYGLTSSIFEEVMATVKEMPSARNAVRILHERGAITAIVSGGFKALADRVQRSFKIRHALAGCEYFFHPQTGLLEYWNLLPADYEGKVDFLNTLIREYNISKGDCVFVGDAQNDIAIAREVGLSVAFNAQQDLKSVSTCVIDQEPGNEDFTEVVTCILAHYGFNNSL